MWCNFFFNYYILLTFTFNLKNINRCIEQVLDVVNKRFNYQNNSLCPEQKQKHNVQQLKVYKF